MTRTEVLTNFAKFKQLCTAIDSITAFIGCVGVPIEYKGIWSDYRYKLIKESQPNLTRTFLEEFDDAIYERCSYRMNNNIVIEDDNDWHQDNFYYVRERLSHWINENEEDEKSPKHLTNEQVEEARHIYKTKGKLASFKYIKENLPGISLNEVKEYFDNNICNEEVHTQENR